MGQGETGKIEDRRERKRGDLFTLSQLCLALLFFACACEEKS